MRQPRTVPSQERPCWASVVLGMGVLLCTVMFTMKDAKRCQPTLLMRGLF